MASINPTRRVTQFALIDRRKVHVWNRSTLSRALLSASRDRGFQQKAEKTVFKVYASEPSTSSNVCPQMTQSVAREKQKKIEFFAVHRRTTSRSSTVGVGCGDKLTKRNSALVNIKAGLTSPTMFKTVGGITSMRSMSKDCGSSAQSIFVHSSIATTCQSMRAPPSRTRKWRRNSCTL